MIAQPMLAQTRVRLLQRGAQQAAARAADAREIAGLRAGSAQLPERVVEREAESGRMTVQSLAREQPRGLARGLACVGLGRLAQPTREVVQAERARAARRFVFGVPLARYQDELDRSLRRALHCPCE